ncbi:hypothetical protein [Rummeliibacillus stabekisii]|uniref:hypothetical protein n=1 Tax=Rummeliibacillus stabekisii TaxID=241244 RepID=UPI00116E2D45|nr:hypothetical protein [Rummeliibacillus stabekisii]MBB5168921.1 hypothetical protein [Rummeliibacillus stabekisii]GEL04935.1 hypothetical protein RST01_15620 [Rummeliibacillus stabekisii]
MSNVLVKSVGSGGISIITRDHALEMITENFNEFFDELENMTQLETEALKNEIQGRNMYIQQLKSEKELLLKEIGIIKKVNNNLLEERKKLRKEIDAKNKIMDFTDGMIVLLNKKCTLEEKQKVIEHLFRIGIDDENSKLYIEEFIDVLSNCLSLLDVNQSKRIKSLLKKNIDFYHELFSNTTPQAQLKILHMYKVKNWSELLENFLERTVQSNSLKRFSDIEGLNLLLYIIYYKKLSKLEQNKTFKLYYHDQNKPLSAKLYKSYHDYSLSKTLRELNKFISIISEEQKNIDLLKGEIIQYFLEKVFTAKEVENYRMFKKYNIQTAEKKTKQFGINFSELRKYGYQISGRTDEQRWQALNDFVEEYGLEVTVAELSKRIKLKSREEDQKKYSNALCKWNSDLEKLKIQYYRGDFPWPNFEKKN